MISVCMVATLLFFKIREFDARFFMFDLFECVVNRSPLEVLGFYFNFEFRFDL